MKLGTTELLIILAVVLLIFGPSQLPKLSKMLGRSVKGLRDGMKDVEDDNSTASSDDTEEK